MRIEIFTMRLVLSIGFAVLLQRLFHFLGNSIWVVAGLAGLMLALSYIFESLRKR